MKPDEILLNAIEKKLPGERAAFLEGACGHDASLRALVEDLLKSHDAAGSFLEKPFFGSAPGVRPGSVLDEASVLSRLDPSGRLRPRMLMRDAGGGPSPVMLPGGGRTEGRYRLVGEIARGGVGVVHKGQDIDLGREVALKVLREEFATSPEMLQRFVEEAQIGGQLQHPGIVPVYELGLGRDGMPFFTMKLVKGRTLALLLAERKSPSQDRRRFLGIFESVCQTMAYAHARGVIHRDLKPSNVMVGAFAEVLVVDWGMGKVLAEGGIVDERRARQRGGIETVRSGSVRSDSVSGSVMGTPAYMPPEQARGEVERLDEKSDVFSLGAILCEVLCGDPPYIGAPQERMTQAVHADLADACARLDGCGADTELVELAKACLSVEPRGRPKDAGEVAEGVSAYLASVEERAKRAQIEASQATLKASEERRRRKLGWALSASVIAFVLIGGGGAYWAEASNRARSAESARAVGDALEEATILRARASSGADLGVWNEALSAAKRAEALSRSRDADDSMHVKATKLRGDIEEEDRAARELAQDRAREDAFVVRLEEIRESHSEHFDGARLAGEIAGALKEYGLDFSGDEDPSALARRVRESPIAVPLVGAMDEWRAVGPSLGVPAGKLTQVLEQADPDPWRARLRSAGTLQQLEELARAVEIKTMPNESLQRLLQRLWALNAVETGRVLARAVQAKYPEDYWANFHAGLFSMRCTPPTPHEALRYCSCAVALRPRSSMARNNLAVALLGTGDIKGSVAASREAIRLNPTLTEAHHSLGNALRTGMEYASAVTAFREAIRLRPGGAASYVGLGDSLNDLGDREGAIAAYREAIRIEAGCAEAHVKLGYALRTGGDCDGAVAAYREAIRKRPDMGEAHVGLCTILRERGDLDDAVAAGHAAIRLRPDLAAAHASLANALRDNGDLEGGIVAYREAIRLEPGKAMPHVSLSRALRAAGRFVESLAALREGHKLGTASAGWRYPTAAWVLEAEPFAVLEPRFFGVLRGTEVLAGAAERAQFAMMAYYTSRFAAAAALLGNALREDPKLARTTETYRVSAARAAAQAGAGRGVDAPPESERAALRAQAIAWLRDELSLGSTGHPDDLRTVSQNFALLKRGPEFAGIRDEAGIAALPAPEQEACRVLWRDVDLLIARAGGGTPVQEGK